MAINIITNIDKYVFSSELQMFSFKTDSASSSVSITAPDGNVILSGSYTPDANKIVTIYDLQRLVDSYISNTIDKFIIKIENEAPITFSIIKSSIRVNSTAFDFLQNNFLSTLQGEKPTAIGRYEHISFIPTELCNIDAICTYFRDGALISKTVKIISDIPQDDVVISSNVSSDRFLDVALGDLICYRISADKRKQDYYVIPSPPPADPAIIFKNCFDCWETLYLTGAKTQEPEYTRSSVYINGSLTNYDIDEKIVYKASTGPMPKPLINLACDLARSKYLGFVDKLESNSHKIIITACETKYSNDDSSMPDFTFTYRLASRITSIIEIITKPKLFDNKFDATYE